MRNVVVGVLYPGVESFLPDYIRSINSQTKKDFELLLFDNSFEGIEAVKNQFDKGISLKIIPIEKKLSAAAPRRKFIIDTLKNETGITNILFTDTDDFFDEKKVELMTSALEKEDIVFIDLIAVDERGVNLNRESFLSGITEVTFTDMIDKNLLGFSNTGVKWELLDRMFPYEEDLLVGDWWFFSSLLSDGLKATLVEGTYLYYRQYSLNVAGMRRIFTEENVTFGMEVKTAHYKGLLKYLHGEKAISIRQELNAIIKLKKQLTSPESMEKYLKTVNSLEKTFCWWEHINLKYLKR